MSCRIVNLNELSLDDVIIPAQIGMPDLDCIQEETWVSLKQNTIDAVCSLWTRNGPTVDHYRTAIAGNFFATAVDAGTRLLHHVSERMRASGFDYLVGPMNGDTWHSYRLVTASRGYPPFFMEYFTPEAWLSIFTDAGFKPIASYHSSMVSDLTAEDNTAIKFAAKKGQLSLTIRPFDLMQPIAELKAIHRLSQHSFSRNFLYTDISQADFLALYEKIIPYIDAEFFLMVEHNGKLVGFIFAIPDYCQQQRGDAVDTLIIKTLARAPDRCYAGLGSYLVDRIQKKAASRHFTRVIHALMSEDNASCGICVKSAQIIRKYAVYGKRLH